MSNRLFAYLLNIDTAEFNKMEVNVMARLGFECYVQTDMYWLYQTQVDTFMHTRADELQISLDQYYVDKRVLKELRAHVEQQRNSPEQPKFERSHIDYFQDSNLQSVLESKNKYDRNTSYPSYVSKFRFESYNSYTLDPISDINRKFNSRTEWSPVKTDFEMDGRNSAQIGRKTISNDISGTPPLYFDLEACWVSTNQGSFRRSVSQENYM